MWYASYLVKSAMAADLHKSAAPQIPFKGKPVTPPKPGSGTMGQVRKPAIPARPPDLSATNMALRGAGDSAQYTQNVFQPRARGRDISSQPMPAQPAGAQSPFLDPVSAHPGMALGLGLGTAGLGYLTGNALYDAAGGKR